VRADAGHAVPVDAIALDRAVAALAASRDRVTGAVGLQGSGASLVVAALAARADAPQCVLLMTAHLDEADDAFATLAGLGADVAMLPALEQAAGETAAASGQYADRIALVRQLLGGGNRTPRVIVAPAVALMQGVPGAADMDATMRPLVRGARESIAALSAWLSSAGYERVQAVESPGDFAVRGGLVDIFPAGTPTPVRIDFFGDEIERIQEVDIATQASDRAIERVDVVRATGEALDERSVSVAGLLPEGTVAVLAEVAEIAEQSRGYEERLLDGRGVWPLREVIAELQRRGRIIELSAAATSSASPVALPMRPLPAFSDDARAGVAEAVSLAESGGLLLLCDTPGERMRAQELVDAALATCGDASVGGRIGVIEAHLREGLVWEGAGGPVALVPMHQVLHRHGARRRGRAATRGLPGARAREAFLQIEPGDFVVHRDHGIAKYVRLRTADGKSEGEEFLELQYEGGATLLVPASKVVLVQRYVGAGGPRPQLSKLGGKRWKRVKADVEEAIKDLAGELLRVQAVREAVAGIAYPADSQWQREFEAEFPFEETPDQAAAIVAAKRDMERTRPMDRLVCGDVGFGKTEVALRAAFKAVDSGRQVAVLVPTTVLAEQHERTFRERMRAYPFRIESVSRFKGDAASRRILQEVAAGQVDVVIGTHRLLSADVAFKDLGLVVIDEEQRFGVEHKQRLLEFRLTADVLTLSATPIPRTLHMSMLGLRDISSLTTPPPDRRAIVTEVIPWNPARLAAAISRELAREGQVFYVHNRVHDMDEAEREVRQLAPGARIVVGHGQMSGTELEDVMVRFMRGDADILLSTTIIESGIDIPRANTMIIDDAHMFGLSELHQLRGRVGRSMHRAYCYMLLPRDRPVTPEAMKRLRAIEDYSMLGAGFKIAVRDLEIRGAGNILGAEQSGHIAAVGYEMYCELLEQAVAGMRQEVRHAPIDTPVEIGLAGGIPRAWIPSDRRRLEAHRRIGGAATLEELAQLRTDLAGAYGEPPPAVDELLLHAELRVRAMLCGVRSIQRKDPDVIFRTADADGLVRRLRGVQGSVRVISEGAGAAADGSSADAMREVFWRPPGALLAQASIARMLQRRLAPEGALASRPT
jgi:transcription-repair coupling factor (superfamily II helicase)